MNRNRLPLDYTIRKQNDHFIDTNVGIVYQPHVYELLSFLATRSRPSRIINIGAGSGDKLRGLDQEFEVICIDTPHIRDYTIANVPQAKFIECNLERGLPSIASSLWDKSLVICTDVLEHLKEPEVLARDLASVRQDCAFMLISTPDRVRARGVLDQGPPLNRAHTMEWAIDEFARFLNDCGFETKLRVGYTRSNSLSAAKSTILAIAGREAEYVPVELNLRVAAIIHVFNEFDIIEATIRHLIREGVEVHIIDNWSDDGSFELCERLLAEGLITNLSRFPDHPSSHYKWTEQLKHTEDYAQKLSADWIIHCDADEVRLSPWPTVTLLDGIKFVDSLGYSAIDFTVLNFFFTDCVAYDHEFKPANFVEFDFGRHSSYLWQIKAWKNLGVKVNLSASGGHSVEFPNRRVYPFKFLTKHYPLRSERQANLKVFRNRIPRLSIERQEKGWHQHYDVLQFAKSVEPWCSFELYPFDQHIFELEFVVESLSGIGIEQDSVYSVSKRTLVQTNLFLAKEFQKCTDQIKNLEQGVADLIHSRQAAEKAATALRASTSWRITEPLRRVAYTWKKCTERIAGLCRRL